MEIAHKSHTWRLAQSQDVDWIVLSAVFELSQCKEGDMNDDVLPRSVTGLRLGFSQSLGDGLASAEPHLIVTLSQQVSLNTLSVTILGITHA